MNRKYRRIQTSVTIGHAEWRRVRRRGMEPVQPIQPPLAERLAGQWRRMVALATAAWARLTKQQLAVVSLALGLFVGLVVLGWWLWPVQWDASTWTGANFNNLPAVKRELVIDNSADLFSYTVDQGRVQALLADWPGAADDICRLAADEADDAQRMRYEALLYITTGQMCADQADKAAQE